LRVVEAEVVRHLVHDERRPRLRTPPHKQAAGGRGALVRARHAER
jgi:hypothetical protein